MPEVTLAGNGIRADARAYTPARDDGFVRKHVAQHFRANRPGTGPAVCETSRPGNSPPPNASASIFAQRAALSAKSSTGLLRRAARAVELWWNLQMRSCKPDPLAATLCMWLKIAVMVRTLPGRLGSPGFRVKMFDKNLVHAITGGEDLN